MAMVLCTIKHVKHLIITSFEKASIRPDKNEGKMMLAHLEENNV